MMSQKLVIVGEGVAAVSAAKAARAHYPLCDITLIGEESSGFYNRIAVTQVAIGKASVAQLQVLPPNAMDYLDIKGIRATATAIDRNAQTIETSTGHKVAYDRLILATGARPARPPISGLDQVSAHQLWTVADAQKIAAQLGACRSVLILGGGVLGIEAALALGEAGKQVTVLEYQKQLLRPLVPSNIADQLAHRLKQTGIQIQTGVTITSARTTGRQTTLVSDAQQTVTGDLLLLCAGVRPHIELARQAGLETNNGIVVDSALQTSDPHILACGNCASPPMPPPLLWNPAAAQGEIAGANAFGNQKSWDTRPTPIHLKSERHPLFVMGDETAAGQTIVQTEPGARSPNIRQMIVDAHGLIRYACFMGDTTGSAAIEHAILNHIQLPDTLIADGRINQIIDHLTVSRTSETTALEGWVCRMCGYTHEGPDAPHVCPVCGCGKDQFLAA